VLNPEEADGVRYRAVKGTPESIRIPLMLISLRCGAMIRDEYLKTIKNAASKMYGA